MNKCKHCGKDFDAAAKFCPHCGKEYEADIVKQVKDAVAEGVKGIADRMTSVEDKLKKIEDMPAMKKISVNTMTQNEYKGMKLANQFRAMRNKAAKNPADFPNFANDEKVEELAKFAIDYVRATALKDVQAVIDLNKAQAEMRQKASDLVEGTDSLGGYLVPPDFQPELIRLAEETSFALRECTVIQMASKELPIPTNLTRVSVTWEDEAASIDESNPTFGQVKLTAKKLAGLTDGISLELIQDSAFDLAGELMTQFMYAIGLELDNQVLNGTGSPCSGLLTAAAGYSVVMSLANFSSVSFTDASLMISKLTEGDRQNAKFVFNRLITHYFRSMKDSQNRPIFTEISAREPRTLYGAPYIESSQATSTTGSSTAFGIYGDLKKFYIGRRLGAMALDADPYTEFGKALVHFRILSRWALAIARSTAFVRLVTGS